MSRHQHREQLIAAAWGARLAAELDHGTDFDKALYDANELADRLRQHSQFQDRPQETQAQQNKTVPLICTLCGRDCDATWDAHRLPHGVVCDGCLEQKTLSCSRCGRKEDPRDILDDPQRVCSTCRDDEDGCLY